MLFSRDHLWISTLGVVVLFITVTLSCWATSFSKGIFLRMCLTEKIWHV